MYVYKKKKNTKKNKPIDHSSTKNPSENEPEGKPNVDIQKPTESTDTVPQEVTQLQTFQIPDAVVSMIKDSEFLTPISDWCPPTEAEVVGLHPICNVISSMINSSYVTMDELIFKSS